MGTIRLGVFRGVKVIASPSKSLQIRLGLWDIRRAAHEASWVIDIGAGSGEASIFFDCRTKAEPIIAVEAWDVRLLRRNIELNRSHRIEVLEQYLGIETDRIPLNSLKVPRDQRDSSSWTRILQSSVFSKAGNGFLRKANHCSLSRPVHPRWNTIVVAFSSPAWIQHKDHSECVVANDHPRTTSSRS